MRTNLLFAAATVLAACGVGDPSSTQSTVSKTDGPAAANDRVSSRAIRTPGSVAELDGVLVRYYEPSGEGPGFDVRFRDDGTVDYEFLGHDPQQFTTTSSTIDVDVVLALVDGIEPADLAAGADDCMPELDGSAPRLSIATFEIDYCYTNRTDHPLVELVRSAQARLDAELRELNEPPGTSPPDGFPAPDAFEGVLARYRMPGGECDRCDFVTTFRDDGTVELRSSRGDHDSTYDVAALRDLLAVFRPAEFVTAATDCGREVDGNAPILEVAEAVIDLCFWDHDGRSSLYRYVVAEHMRVEAERDGALSGDVVIAQVARSGGLCVSGACSAVWRFLADGSWTADANGTVTAGTYDAVPLVEAIRADHLSSPVLGPFTDDCPTAYDGSETSYRLTDPTTGAVVLDTTTCTDEIDPEHPLILAVEDAISQARAQTAG